MKPVVAYVDDDIANLNFYKTLLSDEFEVETFIRSVDLVNKLSSTEYDCFILDIYMPFMDGFQLYDRIRKQETKKTPVFFVTTNPHDEVKVASFQKGAADFFDRLIKKDELIARIQSKVRIHREMMAIHKLGSLKLDIHAIEVTLKSQDVILTLIEFKILSKLLQMNPSKISKAELITHVWGRTLTNSNNLNSHLYNLRVKLADWEYEIIVHKQFGFWLELKKNP